MSKAAKIAAIVVGVAAVVLSAGIGLGIIAGGAALFTIGGLAVTASALASALTLTATAFALASGTLQKKPALRSTGSQLDFIADPAAGEPYVVGDAMVGMKVVHEATWGDQNKYLGIVGIICCAGPIMAYDGLYADMKPVTFTGRNADGYYHDFMLLSTGLGTRPQATLNMTALDASGMPDWSTTDQHRFSSFAGAGLVLTADIEDGKIYSGGVPKLTNRVRGVLAYDARADSTQTGGSGTQRALTETTYVYSENPWVHASTYAIGRWVNGKLVIGPGLPPAQVDWASYMEAANIADANDWKISGLIDSTDRKWDVQKALAQAGGGVPLPTGGHLSCLVNTPRVSIETIEESDLKGPVIAPQMLTRRQRLNGAIPRYRSADHGWEIVPASAIRNSTWLAADGGKEATREIEFPLVADKGDGLGLAQAAQLAAYAVADTRERGPISLELSYYWSQYKLGDCLTLNIPSARLVNQKCIVIGRSINAARNTITLEFRTEDDSKHTWALSQTGTAAPPTTVEQDPGAGDTGGQLTLGELQLILKATVPLGLDVTADDAGTSATVHMTAFELDYPEPYGNVPVAAHDYTLKAFSTTYYPYVDVASPGDVSPAFGITTVYEDSFNTTAHPYRISLARTVTTPADGGTATGGGGVPPGSGSGGGGALP